MPVPEREIRLQPVSRCCVCGAEGKVAYSGLSDRLFGVPGTWTLKYCEDAQCGTHWLDPRPVDEDLPSLYANYYTHQEVSCSQKANGLKAALKHLWRRACDSYLQRQYGYAGASRVTDRFLGNLLRLNPVWCADLDFSVFYLREQRDGRLLEVGFGSGAMLHEMARRGWQVSGVEFDRQAVDNATAQGLSVRHGSLQEQKFRENSFDVIVMSHVIEHVPDPKALIAECSRILAPGGRLILVTPNIAGTMHREFGKNWLHLDPPRHLNLFTPASFRRLVAQAGFVDVDVKTSVRDAGNLWLASTSLASQNSYAMVPAVGGEKLRAALAAWYYGLRFRMGIASGDELVAVAQKTGASS